MALDDEDAQAVIDLAKSLYGDGYSLDPLLWVVLTWCGERDYLVGNTHTFPGRMGAFCPHLDGGQGFAISAADIVDKGEAARWWLAGYLAGNEPNPHDAVDEATWDARWSSFRQTGDWPLAWGLSGEIHD